MGVDSEILKKHMDDLKTDIRDDYSQNFWKYFGEIIMKTVVPKTQEIVSEEFKSKKSELRDEL